MRTAKTRPAFSRLDPEVNEQLRWLARDLDTSVSGLLRWGVMLVLQECGEELPDSLVPQRRKAFGGEVPEFANRVNPETISVQFDDPTYAAIQRVAERRRMTVMRYVADLVEADLTRRGGG